MMPHLFGKAQIEAVGYDWSIVESAKSKIFDIIEIAIDQEEWD